MVVRYDTEQLSAFFLQRFATFRYPPSHIPPRITRFFMIRLSLPARSLLATVALTLTASAAQAQRVVVSHDEWVTQSGSFNANEQAFMSNTLNWFGAGSGSSALIYSNNSYITNSGFTSYLSGKGITSTTDANAASFAGFKVIFVEANQTMNAAGLASYVKGGGNVVYFGGTGQPNSAGEAAYSNAFLSSFGFNLADTYNGLGTVNTSGFAAQGPFGAALFTGVSSIFASNGSNVMLTPPVAGVTSQLFSDVAGNGVFGAAVYKGTIVTPEPATLGLVAFGLMVAVPLARRRKR